MTLSIAGLGTALPRYSITIDLMAEFCTPFCCENAEQAEQLKLIFAKSGVRQKHTVLLEGECRDGLFPQSFYPQTYGERGPSTGRRMQAYEQAAPILAQAASQKALSDAGVAAGDIT